MIAGAGKTTRANTYQAGVTLTFTIRSHKRREPSRPSAMRVITRAGSSIPTIVLQTINSCDGASEKTNGMNAKWHERKGLAHNAEPKQVGADRIALNPSHD
jgi:hypothetical protein